MSFPKDDSLHYTAVVQSVSGFSCVPTYRCAVAPRRALRVCEQKPLYLALLGILERSGHTQLAGEVWRTATKKFNSSCKVWYGGVRVFECVWGGGEGHGVQTHTHYETEHVQQAMTEGNELPACHKVCHMSTGMCVVQLLWGVSLKLCLCCCPAVLLAVGLGFVVQVWLGAFESALQAAQRQAAAAEEGEGQDAAAAAAAAANAPRQLLERALKSLPKRKHVKALTRYGPRFFSGCVPMFLCSVRVLDAAC